MDTHAPTYDPLYSDEENEARETHSSNNGVANALNEKYQNALDEEHGIDPLSKRAKDILRENAPAVANELVYLALHATRETTRLSAAKVVLDRVLGPVNDKTSRAGNEFADLLASVSRQSG